MPNLNSLKSLYLAVLFLGTLPLLSGCNVAKQMGAAKAFSECQFRVKGIEQVVLGPERGNFVSARPYADIPTWELLKNLVGSDPYFLMFQIRIEARNPNAIEASMNRLEWILLFQEREMARGIVKDKIHIPPGPVSITDFTVNIEMNVREVLSGDTAKGLAQMVGTLTGFSEEDSSITVRVKPTLVIAGMDYTVADYINVKAKFSADQGKELRKSLLKGI
ncbi:MAG: hypothetical protein JNL01_04430 [Bdellovibrionales bacterium]|nr:hypothetical protein [Bdellovibrionales bacterium]